MTEQPNDEDRFTVLDSNVNELNEQVGAIRQDMTAIRQDVTDARRDAAAARILAGGADRDVNEVRNEIRDFRQAATMSLNALRKTQREHGQLLSEHTKQIQALDSKVDAGFAEMRSTFDQLAGGQQEITGLLTTLISQQGE